MGATPAKRKHRRAYGVVPGGARGARGVRGSSRCGSSRRRWGHPSPARRQAASGWKEHVLLSDVHAFPAMSKLSALVVSDHPCVRYRPFSYSPPSGSSRMFSLTICLLLRQVWLCCSSAIGGKIDTGNCRCYPVLKYLNSLASGEGRVLISRPVRRRPERCGSRCSSPLRFLEGAECHAASQRRHYCIRPCVRMVFSHGQQPELNCSPLQEYGM